MSETDSRPFSVSRAVRLHLYGGAAAAIASALVLLLFTPYAVAVRDRRPVLHPAGIAAVVALSIGAALVLRRSRVAALALAAYFVASVVLAAPWRAGIGAMLTALVLAYLYAGGVWATFTWHRRASIARRETAAERPPQ